MKVSRAQISLPRFTEAPAVIRSGQANNIDHQDRAFHDWYRFVLSFPPHLVRTYLQEFEVKSEETVLDPFCGTGTTLVEAKTQGIPSIGLEGNPFAHFASSVKVDWEVDPDQLMIRANEIADSVVQALREQGIEDSHPFEGDIKHIPLRTLDPKASKLLIGNSISSIPLHKSLMLLESLNRHCHERYYRHALLAFANALVFSVSNLRFGPEVGVGKIKNDAPLIGPWLAEVEKIAADLRSVFGHPTPPSYVHLADARHPCRVIKSRSVTAVITSPPYPNEKDYTRTTRLESVVLGFIKSRADLRALKDNLVRSNTRAVFKKDDDDRWVKEHPGIQRIADAIDARRAELGKTSGFEKLYGRVTRLYFGGMSRHLGELREVLRPGANLAYVVGDQASYFRIMIRTGELLSDIAQTLGYEVVRTDLFRTRFSTATKEQLREEVVVLRWPGLPAK